MGRRDTARRRLAGAGLPAGASQSQLELGSCKSGFPPGTTVDELRWYSRRRANDTTRKQDNLFLESGSLKDITSEYTRCFKAPPVASYSLGDLTDSRNDQKENILLRRYSSNSEDILNPDEMTDNKWNRRSRRQNLKLEGDMLFQTENGEEFIEYVLGKRRDLLRRDTQLKLEGEIDTMTENQEKFIPFDNYQRPPLAKRSTTLHLEGDHLYMPEYKDLFVEFPRKRPITKRPSAWLHINGNGKMNSSSETFSQFVEHVATNRKSEILRRPANLKCEGDISLLPEYRDSFREYPLVKQFSIRKPPSLKLEGELYTTPEYRDKYTSFPNIRLKPIKHFDKLHFEDDIIEAQGLCTLPKAPSILNLPTERGLTMSTDTAMLAKPPTPTKAVSPDMTKLKPKSDLNASQKKHVPTYPKSKTKLPSPTEERPTGRPPRSPRTRTWSQSSPSHKRDYQAPRDKEKHTNDPDDKLEYVPTYRNIYADNRPQPMRQPEYLVDDRLESQPEYRKAYLDYLIKEKLPRKPPIDPNSEKKQSRHDDPSQNLQSSKGILVDDKRRHPSKENVAMYQPTLRRGSNTSNHSSPRRRSASPSYRMHVTNVDEPKKGFGGRTLAHIDRDGRKNEMDSSMKNSSRSNWIKNIAQHKAIDTNYQTGYTRDNKSFVVLDNVNDDSKSRRKWESPWWNKAYN